MIVMLWVMAQQNDPYTWLEEVEGAKALEWVKARNRETLEVLEGDPRYKAFHEQALAILTATDRIPYGRLAGGKVYNFWQDATHVRGLWRRTTAASYAMDSPEWETVLDLDRLAEQEKESWVWKGVVRLPPDHARCLISLSRGGGDAVVVREFDTETRSFVADGFRVPEAKSDIAWIDRDTVLVSTDFGKGTLTTSGYPRQVRRWRRGTPLEEATLLYEGQETDVAVSPTVVHRPEGTAVFVVRSRTFFDFEVFHVGSDRELTRLPVPEWAEFSGLFDGQSIFRIRKEWTRTKEETIPSGAVFSFSLAEVLTSDRPPRIEVLLAPDERTSVQSVDMSRSRLYLTLLQNVKGRLVAFERREGKWTQKAVPLPETGSLSISSSSDFDDAIFINYEDFLTPDRLLSIEGADRVRVVKRLPARFDGSGLFAEQFEAVSKDGTKVPYFVVRKKGGSADGASPTLLYGYGGFEISMTPWYSAVAGKLWLERGGVYAVANGRGGGEFGPRWHQAALKLNRQRAFDDFIAVAEDLIARKITSPRRLGIMGGSNGGLLVGTAMVQRPELFGAVVCQVPLLDMLRYAKLPPGASWMAEYGDPDVPEEREAIVRYSPYQNLHKDGKYPRIFFVTSTKDDRVHPGHARKMAARMSEYGQPFYYYENTEGGHAGAADLKQAAHQAALTYVYLFRQLID